MLLATPCMGFMPEEDVYARQRQMVNAPVGQRIAFWAEQFVGTPYDTDPNGEYVSKNIIVADDRVDCMYLTFRAVELGLSVTPAGAIETALGMRFPYEGYLKPDATVQNYWERYQYAEDMLFGGKWGIEMTKQFQTPWIAYKGSRGIKYTPMIATRDIPSIIPELKDGDIIYFVKDISRRVVGEIVGHLGIIRRDGGKTYMVHASGSKNKGGEVRKVEFSDYVSDMPFVGIMVGRFN